MSRFWKLTIGLLAFAFFMLADPVSYRSEGSWTSSAEAMIGRPATPMSYAGVARRTARRW
jgi:hypothetical protein